MGVMSNARVLVVDDDAAIAEMVSIVLRTKGYESRVCGDGLEALDSFADYEPDLILLDVMLPGMNGVEVCRRIRQQSLVPIIMLTALTDTADVVEGLEAGADDYLTKPFEPEELVARIKARVRRQDVPSLERYNVSDIVIDVNAHVVSRDGVDIPLTPIEFDLLLTLVRKPWQVFTREQILREVWGYSEPADTRLVNVHVQRLRAKVEKDPDNPVIVQTVRGIGYRAAQR
ncbi:response regulator transcription factor [Dermabacteraceae bacterium TAE3-ERU5]|nr:response regulator transcription factor [Dermabacteraceae bacterium TAE3-ERU27]MBV7432738.1 response regulator transcription factor [Dermabacteraceae bacterium TAE3-ERU5]